MNETNEVRHITEVIKDSPDEDISEDYAQSLQKFIYNQEHIKWNTVCVKLHVKTSALWKNPRSCICTKGNGAEVDLVRIYMK